MKEKIVVITGANQGIGLEIKRQFEQNGAIVCDIDIEPGGFFQGDIGNQKVIERFCEQAIEKYGHIDYLINNAMPLMKGISECSYDDFVYALNVGVTAPFYLTKCLTPYFNEGASIINITSTRAFMSQKETESYSASKGALEALTHSLAMSLQGKARVNAIAPGWIDTTNTDYQDENALQHLVKRVGHPSDIASMVLYLCSDKASFITGQSFTIDGGMSKQMIYHHDQGWEYKN
ncbi:SDR family NAD(P)-dependent oxidoreductase [Macrococcus sp. DPC7161]|uniref:SDR family NAD(P)-dependent oxidoreductase n=1 Tax=Macrococcus sp. DPC7161 TaxID=2507060 RepID=UPI001F0C7696|nr:SDR family oxidoreductase [Macrococcus sp. DPC7161]